MGGDVSIQRTVLSVVDGGGQGPAIEGILDQAMDEVSHFDIAQILFRAETLAQRTVTLMRVQRDPSSLASVTLAIGDQRLKVAFLEAVGQRLI